LGNFWLSKNQIKIHLDEEWKNFEIPEAGYHPPLEAVAKRLVKTQFTEESSGVK
jgi:hypothetical protein